MQKRSSDCFNSRTREGCDITPSTASQWLTFQFTHPRGVRYDDIKHIAGFVGFNSRTREGCDATQFCVESGFWFQFTHPRGVRSRWSNCAQVVIVSIHAPARGAIPNPYEQGRRKTVSIHAPARGAMLEGNRCRNPFGFNSRTREGCDN